MNRYTCKHRRSDSSQAGIIPIRADDCFAFESLRGNGGRSAVLLPDFVFAFELLAFGRESPVLLRRDRLLDWRFRVEPPFADGPGSYSSGDSYGGSG